MAEIISLIVATAELSHGILRALHSLASIRHVVERSLWEADRVGMFLIQLVDILTDPRPRYMPQMLPCALWIAQDCSWTYTKLRDVAHAMAASRIMRLRLHRKLRQIQAELEHQKSILHFTVTMLPAIGNQPGIYRNAYPDVAVELDSTNVETLIHEAESRGSARLQLEAEVDGEPVERSISSSPSGSASGIESEDSNPDIDTSLILLSTDNRMSPVPYQDSNSRNQGQQPMAGTSPAPTRSEWMQALVAFLAAIWREPAVVNLLHGPSSPMDNRMRLENQTQPPPLPPRPGVNSFQEDPVNFHTMDLMTSVGHSVMLFHGGQSGIEAYGSASRRDSVNPPLTHRPQSPITRGPTPGQVRVPPTIIEDHDSFSTPFSSSVPRNVFHQSSQSQLPPSTRGRAHGNNYAGDAPDAAPRRILWETRQKRRNRTDFKSYVDDRLVSRMDYPWDDIVLKEVWTSLRRRAVDLDELQRYGFEYQAAGRYVHVFAKLDWGQVRRISFTAGQ
ncbi:hypothetical protein BO94DRAFT_531509 [Aspergillus sclerotioniger CBS 115572]|uniref:Uncharacterized protein n=1 Tax=Aspergillus sclerotioniger CBS 115572 TaxID=1450535 RepID=A0A317X8P0_9EURO|nr:hypothetical protein BO94DRAFT_531509 [Aspergillus sclerotioniger CBS 115572]PWY94551.1 hypothetical protein BO94DRAFT_531509 [Aspergillus sclerotioniger CBS 115572]